MANPINPSAFFAEIQNRESEPQSEAKEQKSSAKRTKKTQTLTGIAQKNQERKEKGIEARQPYTIYLPENVRKKLEEERYNTKATFSDIIERALKDYFALLD